MEETKQEEKKKRFDYNKWYHYSFIIPLILLAISLSYLVYFYQQNGDIIHKDITLKGGTSITVYSQTDIAKLNQFLKEKFSDFDVREISDLRSGSLVAFTIDVSETPEVAKPIIEEYLGIKLDEKNSSIEFTDSSISQGFYSQLRIAIIAAFILMSAVVFILFRSLVPSFAVILSAFADIVIPLALVDFLGMKLSSAGIIAFLMLIGYSVDSDILLTTRVLKRRDEPVNARIYSAFKTGMTMTLTAIAAVLVSLLIVRGLSSTLSQIFTILLIGLCFDIINTWFTNAGLLKWYADKKGL